MKKGDGGNQVVYDENDLIPSVPFFRHGPLRGRVRVHQRSTCSTSCTSTLCSGSAALRDSCTW